MEETGRLVSIVLLASFAIERTAATVDFFLAEKNLSEKHRKLVRVGVSVLIALGVVLFTGIRILGAMKFNSPSAGIDFLLTWLVLVAGADKIDQFLGAGAKSGAGAAPAKKDEIRPVQIFIDNNEVTGEALRVAS